MSNLNITLRDITTANWETCLELQVRDDQDGYVAPNTYSLVQAAYEPDFQWTPLGIYCDETMVGFLMYGQPEYPEFGRCVWEICRLMVDKNHQGKGYGRAAMVEAIRRISSHADCDSIYIAFHPENAAAQALYTSLGFVHAGMMIDHEIVMRLPVKK
jgi:diamine N-acetyltransferase